MMRKFFITILVTLFFVNLTAQTSPYNKIARNKINWGFRVGFNAENTNFYELYQNGEEFDYSTVTNQVGFQGVAFGRINIGASFIQPEISYYLRREKYGFSLPQESTPENPDNPALYITISQKTQSVNTAALFGYDIVKEEAFIFNLYLGPNLRYAFNNNYNESLTNNRFIDKEKHLNLSLITGISVNAFSLYFDFRYEMTARGRKNLTFSDVAGCPGYLQNISVKKNENILHFSIGMMF